MQSKQHPNKQQNRLKKVAPQLYIIIGTLLVAALSYCLLFIYPKQVTFSYAEKTCVQQLTLLPSLQRQIGDSAPFTASLEDRVSLGPLQLASTSTCFTPTSEIAGTTQGVNVSPLAGPLFTKRFIVSTPKAPEVVANAAENGKVSAVRPLEIKLDTQDIIHTYTITSQGKQAPCTPAAALLRCDIATLSLEHGKEYTLQLARQIINVTEAEAVKDFAITTLTPVHITEASVADAQVIYDTPKEFSFIADKALTSTKATLTVLKGETATPVAIKTEVSGVNGRIIPDAPLERKSQYVLTITELDGEDGSSLAEAYSIRFTTSGGPKVTGASIGSSLVPQNGRVIVTFDQAIDDTVDVTKFVKVTGVSGVITKQNATQVAITLQNAPLCAGFAITVDKGVKSGANGTLGEEAWKLDSRIICGTSSTIGYSVRGRAITAYYFGSGSSTILFTGGIHGSEGSSTTTMQAWVTYLQSNGNKIPADKRVVVVPNTNPDAIAAGTRNNVNNVNIARNFPTANWKADIETSNGILVNGGGTSATSEPEAKALASLTRQLRPRLEVSFHAQGKLVGANKVGDSVSIGAVYANLVGYQTMFYNAEAVMGYEMTGEYEDWMGEEMGIPAILIELPGYSGNYLNSQLTALLRMLSV